MSKWKDFKTDVEDMSWWILSVIAAIVTMPFFLYKLYRDETREERE